LIECELARESAKTMVWQGHDYMLKQQDLVTAMQKSEIEQCYHQVAVTICDSPILLGSIYAPHYPDCYHQFLRWGFDQYNNLNFLIKRTKPFNPNVRLHSEKQSNNVYFHLKELLDSEEIPYIDVTSTDLEKITKIVVDHLEKSA
jgi:nicotinamide riboside kinase